MKKIIAITMALLLTLVFSTSTAMAKPGNSNSHNKNTTVIEQGDLTPGQSHKVNTQLKQELKAQKQLLKQVEKTLRFCDTEGHWASQSIEDLAGLGVYLPVIQMAALSLMEN